VFYGIEMAILAKFFSYSRDYKAFGVNGHIFCFYEGAES
jgi:hypothetical protein